MWPTIKQLRENTPRTWRQWQVVHSKAWPCFSWWRNSSLVTHQGRLHSVDHCGQKYRVRNVGSRILWLTLNPNPEIEPVGTSRLAVKVTRDGTERVGVALVSEGLLTCTVPMEPDEDSAKKFVDKLLFVSRAEFILKRVKASLMQSKWLNCSRQMQASNLSWSVSNEH